MSVLGRSTPVSGMIVGISGLGNLFGVLVNDGWLKSIYVGCPKVPLQILRRPGKLIWGSQPKVKDETFQVTALSLEACFGFGIWTFGFFLILLTSVLLVIVCLPLVFHSSSLNCFIQVDRMVYIQPPPSLFFHLSYSYYVFTNCVP